jgi:hypothetical protein
MNIPRLKLMIALLSLAWSAGAAVAADNVAPAPVKDGARPPPAKTAPVSASDPAALVRDFSQARQAYLMKHQQLEQALRKASEPQRQALREQLKTQRDEQARLREELRRQLRELRDQLPTHGELMDEARERPGTRPRRGD